MSDNKEHLTEELGAIIRLMADIWPADRENLPEAGARFEQVIDNFDQNFGQMQKLINLSWDGLKHLYEKDEYFMMVKAATMQAVNTIREYIVQDGDIKVEEFEKSYGELEKSLLGGAESADTVIELDDEEIKAHLEKAEAEKKASGNQDGVTLDDLASFIMTLNEDSVEDDEIKQLAALIDHLAAKADGESAKALNEAKEVIVKVAEGNGDDDWFTQVSDKTEQAIEAESQEEWEESQASSEEKPAKAEPEVAKEEPVTEEAETEVFHIPQDIEISMVGEFVTECSDLIQMAEGALLDLEERPDDEELINTVFRAFHTIKGTSAFMGLDPISEFTHSVETFLSMVREGKLSFDRACADISLESIDIINQMLAVVEQAQGGDPLPEPPAFAPMMKVLHAVSEENVQPKDAFKQEAENIADAIADAEEEAELKAASDAQESAEKVNGESTGGGDKSSGAETESSVRVSVNRLDRLIDMVGELVIAHSVVAQDKAIPKDSELQRKVNHATKIIRELQDTSLTLRMVPLKATFHKMNRLVRDISRKAGKNVKLITVGEDTEIDRNMVDVINEPLIHMLRNSLDHGIETPEERKKTDKDEVAEVVLSASQEGGKVVIKIVDDGRGINKDVILNKAIEKGLIDPDKKLSDKEIYNLIFLPGFSSAEKVTDLSGRGVGMDVVRRSIEQLQGKVDVNSELGKGTTITIELPFTLAITDGMVVRVGQDRFIVPTINIDMTFRAENNDVFTVMGNSEQVSFRGHSVPVIRLHRLFEIKGAVEKLTEGTLLVIKNNNKRYALLVDEVIGQQQLVGKSINIMAKMDHISGGAIMGDGRVGLILDTAALME
ncbi:chemotaxis protein CheA [Gracilimonas mengyeensis]|uniref:Chemotaxis protein CheA n=1 Tax=Gracilimonas mengyeensis TaxID=1302730 RepID=A0A521D728_9BACT|nr:chemotaxis protein CheA [Gracilimonas mengyeensis]SMO67513.1 two-component system, chemotaxis family, sensor kinase CheA [Gracilimonas mengyeensis]